jgi:hypothetical protein
VGRRMRRVRRAWSGARGATRGEDAVPATGHGGARPGGSDASYAGIEGGFEADKGERWQVGSNHRLRSYLAH